MCIMRRIERKMAVILRYKDKSKGFDHMGDRFESNVFFSWLSIVER